MSWSYVHCVHHKLLMRYQYDHNMPKQHLICVIVAICIHGIDCNLGVILIFPSLLFKLLFYTKIVHWIQSEYVILFSMFTSLCRCINYKKPDMIRNLIVGSFSSIIMPSLPS